MNIEGGINQEPLPRNFDEEDAVGHKWRRCGCLIAAAGLAAAAVIPGFSQEKPLSVAGNVYTGFYSTTNQNERETRLSFVPASVDLDLTGYVGAPGFLSYRVRPQWSAGPQATEAGFLGGDGVSLSTTFLSQRSFPLTLTYGNLRQENVFFGTLNQLSGFRSFNHERDLGLNWQLRAPRLPQISLDIGRSALTAKPDIPEIPIHRSRSGRAAMEVRDKRWGWTMNGTLRREKRSSEFANVLAPGLRTSMLRQRFSETRASGMRPLWDGSRLVLSTGVLDTRNKFDDRPYDQYFRFSTAAFNFGNGKRLQGNLRAGYSSNRVGTGLSTTPLIPSGQSFANSPGSEALLIYPWLSYSSNLSLSSNLSYQLYPDWRIFGGVTQGRVRTPDKLTRRNSDYLTGRAGMNFQRRFSWVTLIGQFNMDRGRTRYGPLRSRLRGRAFSVSARHGSVDHLELAISYDRSGQRVDSITNLTGGHRSGEFTVTRRLRRVGLLLRGGAGFQRSFFQDGHIDYRSSGLTFQADVEHHLVQAHYFRNTSDGTTLLDLLFNPSNGSSVSPLLLGVPMMSSLFAYHSQTLHVRTTPWRRFEADLLWTQNSQRFNEQVSNNFSQLIIRAKYRFRMLTFETGYINYEQLLLGLSPFMRHRIYVRISRRFRLF